MTYSKPEVAVLGDANHLIRGVKTQPPENENFLINDVAGFELED